MLDRDSVTTEFGDHLRAAASAMKLGGDLRAAASEMQQGDYQCAVASEPRQGGQLRAAASAMQLGKDLRAAASTAQTGSHADMDVPPPQLGKELELVKHYVLLGIVNAVLEHDIRIVGAAPTKLPRLYESMMRGLQDRVLLELAGLRRQFKASGIGVPEEKRTKDALTASYRCMGYQRSFSMPWTFVRAESERLLKRYFDARKG